MSQPITLREIIPTTRPRFAPSGSRLTKSSSLTLFRSHSRRRSSHPTHIPGFGRSMPVNGGRVRDAVLQRPARQSRGSVALLLVAALIDAEYQRRGYGRAAMALVIDVVRNSPGATDFFTSVHPGDGGLRPSIDPWGSSRPGSGSTARRSFGSFCVWAQSRTLAQAMPRSPAVAGFSSCAGSRRASPPAPRARGKVREGESRIVDT